MLLLLGVALENDLKFDVHIKSLCRKVDHSQTKRSFSNIQCVKIVHMRSFFGSHFPVFGLNTEIYSVNLLIQSEYRKIRTRKYFEFGHFSRSGLSNEQKLLLANSVIKPQFIYCPLI